MLVDAMLSPGSVERSQWQYRQMVAVHSSLIKRQTAIAEDAITAINLVPAVQLMKINVRGQGVSAKTIRDLVPHLLTPLPSGIHNWGRHPTQPVLVCAGPGTGKTWTSVQLCHDLAVACDQAAFTSAVPLVPALIYVQRLIRLLSNRMVDDADIDPSVLVRLWVLESKALPGTPIC